VRCTNNRNNQTIVVNMRICQLVARRRLAHGNVVNVAMSKITNNKNINL